MRGVIIYKGKYGATKQYAEWLGEELRLEVWSAEEITADSLNGYDYFLIGSSVYIGKLQVKKWLHKNLRYLSGKKIFFFQVAGTAPQDKEKRQAYNEACIPKEIMGNCGFYFLPGRTIISKLSWMDRFMVKMGARLIKDPEAKKTMLTDHDDVKKEWLSELIAAVKNYTNLTVRSN